MLRKVNTARPSTRSAMMILRLKSRLASGLTIATVALAGTTVASAADTPPAGNDAATTTRATPGAAGAGDEQAQAKRIFDQLDLNHDGMLSLDEFSRATFQQTR
jgi:hypothetical protein